MTLIHNERTKLTATWLNALASGVIVTGFVAPSVAVLFRIQPFAISATALVASSLLWLSIGVALHFLARRILGRLKP